MASRVFGWLREEQVVDSQYLQAALAQYLASCHSLGAQLPSSLGVLSVEVLLDLVRPNETDCFGETGRKCVHTLGCAREQAKGQAWVKHVPLLVKGSDCQGRSMPACACVRAAALVLACLGSQQAHLFIEIVIETGPAE